jgi:methylthioribose-1-phosphate isomerase
MRTIELKGDVVVTVDQTKLPNKIVYLKLKDCREICEAIKKMRIRGAPLIGVASAYGLALAARKSRARSREALIKDIELSARTLLSTRPTGANLRWAVERVMKRVKLAPDLEGVRRAAVEEAEKIAEEDFNANLNVGMNGAMLIEDGDVVLTHCNAGALATSGFGTALGVVRAAVKQGKKLSVVATETRPLLQGARLTAFELKREGIPVTLITDSMVGYVISKGIVKKVIVGADRILATGHVVNKIGTLTIAIVAKHYNIPFFVAASSSTFDLETKLPDVVIEERNSGEVKRIGKYSIAPRGVPALNPAFDVTPPELITAIITERGVLKPTQIAESAAYA